MDVATAPHPQLVLTLEAVHASAAAKGAATVSDVARQLGLDQSGASRMVAACIHDGYLDSARSVTDARRNELRLTPAGDEILNAAKQWQRDTFSRLTSDWSDQDRVRFSRYLQRLADDIGA